MLLTSKRTSCATLLLSAYFEHSSYRMTCASNRSAPTTQSKIITSSTVGSHRERQPRSTRPYRTCRDFRFHIIHEQFGRYQQSFAGSYSVPHQVENNLAFYSAFCTFFSVSMCLGVVLLVLLSFCPHICPISQTRGHKGRRRSGNKK